VRIEAGQVAVITGAASGFGREFARLGAARGLKLVLADIDAAGLATVVDEISATGADVIGERVDVSRAEEVERLAELAFAHHGRVNLLFNNAGVATGGLIWEHGLKDWEWLLGVNVWSVIHGIRSFVPRMLAQDGPGHVVSTASVAGLLSPPLLGIYNMSKHAVVALAESLYQDMRGLDRRLGVSVLCPAFVPTGIADSERNRPAELDDGAEPAESMKAFKVSFDQGVRSGRLSAGEVARITFEAIEEDRFYIVTHPKIMPSIRQRGDDIARLRNPSDPYANTETGKHA